MNGTIGEYSRRPLDYRANVAVRLDRRPDDLRCSISTGFKGGGVNPRPFFVQQALPFDPETLEAFEAGFKSDLFDRRVRLNVAAFLSKYKGMQLTCGNCTAITGPGFGAPCALPVNAGDADIKGIEVETTIRPIDGLLIDGALSYLDFEYQRFGTFTHAGTGTTVSVGGPTNINGPQFGDYRAVHARVEVELRRAVRGRPGQIGSLTPRFDAAYQSDIYSSAANRSSNLIESYTLANARLTWRNEGEDLEVSAEVTNLFDKYYLPDGQRPDRPGSPGLRHRPARPAARVGGQREEEVLTRGGAGLWGAARRNPTSRRGRCHQLQATTESA